MSMLKIAINKQSKLSTSSNIRCLAFDFNPPSEALRENGELMLFIELKSLPSRIHIKELINTAGRVFYKNNANSTENRFKMSLRAINELLIGGNNDFDIAIAAFNKGSLLLSTVGNPSAIIFNQSGQIKALQNPRTNQFNEIEETILRPGSGLILANSSISSRLQSAKLNKLLSLPKNEASDMLSELIETNDDNISSSCLLISNTQKNSKVQEHLPVKDKKYASATTQEKSDMLNRFLLKLKRVFSNIARLIKSIGSESNRQRLHNIASKMKYYWTNLWTKYINPNPKQAIIVVLITTLIIAFLTWLLLRNIF